MNVLQNYRYWLLNPVTLYGAIFGTYLLPPTITALFFQDYSFLFLQGSWDSQTVIKGLVIFLVSLLSFYFGYSLSSFVPQKAFLPTINYKKTAAIAKVVFLPFLFIAITLIGGTYFTSKYLAGADPESFVNMDTNTRFGVAVLYFTVETFIAFLIISDWNYRKKIRLKTLLLIMIGFLLVLQNMKRLEMITPVMASLAFIYTDKKKTLHVPLLAAFSVVIIASFMGTIRAAGDVGVGSLLSFVLEANFVTNSYYKVIQLIHESGYPYTFGIELLAIPFAIVPGVLLPQKHSMIDVGQYWANRVEISPQGAYYGLAHLYRYGGIYSVTILSIILGFMLGRCYRYFLNSYDGKQFNSIFYPVMIFPFLFHYVRDDIVVAIKISLQLGIILYIFCLMWRFFNIVSNSSK